MLKITITGEGKPLFTLVVTLGGVLLVAYAAVIGITPFERRIILVLLFNLLFWNILSLLSFLDRRMARWRFYGNELYYRYIRRIALQRDQALAKAHDLQVDMDLARAHYTQIENELRAVKRDLDEREKQLGAAQKHIRNQMQEKEALRQEAQQRINSLKMEIEALTKAKAQAKTEYALLLLFVATMCIGLVSVIGLFLLAVFTQVTEFFLQ